jgi:hypothetical protein
MGPLDEVVIEGDEHVTRVCDDAAEGAAVQSALVLFC